MAFLANKTLKKTLTVWGISDARAGNQSQIIGVIRALQEKTPINTRIIPIHLSPWIKNLPNLFFPVLSHFVKKPSEFHAPWPDLWIACGRSSIPYTQKIKHWSAQNTRTIQLLNPKTSLKYYDLIIPPKHDMLDGKNVFSIIGSPNQITDQILEKAHLEFQAKINQYPDPKIAILIGGNTKRNKLQSSDYQEILNIIRALIKQKMSLFITVSRRTPAKLTEQLKKLALSHKNIWLWSGEKESNPYFAFLASAKAILVTSDSTNMLTEACSTGKPVYMIKFQNLNPKFLNLYQDLEQNSRLKQFDGRIEDWDYPPLNETEKCAEKILSLYLSTKKQFANTKN